MGAGCTVNDHGIEGWTCHSVRRPHSGGVEVAVEAWGLHLSTNRADAGAVIGHCRKVYFFALPPGAGDNADPNPVSLERDDPLCIWTEAQGIMVGINPSQVGMAAGVQTRELLMIPEAFQGTVELKIDSANRAATHFRVTR
jgi:hypothetical protein